MTGCPYCNHCKAIENMNREAEKMERRKQEWRVEQEKKAIEKREQDVREGKIFGTDYFMYREEHIKNISDSTFLLELWGASIPCGQPPTDEEYNELMQFSNVIQARIAELK